MRKILIAAAPLWASLLCTAAFFSVCPSAEAHLTVCNSTGKDLAIAEAYPTLKREWDTNSAVLVSKAQCVTFADQPAPGTTLFYLRVLALRQTGLHSFDTAEETYAGGTRSFCLSTGSFSRKAAGITTIEGAQSESTCDYYKDHVHDSGQSIEWIRFFRHALPRPTTHLNLE
ncbi:MAG: DUF1036 domain-containing protein [Vulcanimicrobiaceae bacterium]